jgi:hypothetical protein
MAISFLDADRGTGLHYASFSRGSRVKTSRCVAVAVALSTFPLFSRPAWAGDEGKLRLGHYSSGDGLTGLILDRSGAKPMARFDASDEVFVLTPAEGIRDWTRLVQDDGMGLCSVSKYGEVEVYLKGHNDPVEVARDGGGKSLATVSGASVGDVHQAAREQSEAASRATGATITFDPGKPDGDGLGVYLEAMKNVEVGLAVVGGDDLGKAALKKLHKVAFAPGDTADAKLAGNTLTVTVAQKLGHAGRPSSLLIKKVLEAGL